MQQYCYDFHIHSCLSPCGDADMTPNNIINMAKLKGLDVIALTDHNSCGNCRAAVKVGEREGLLVIPGMELCTSEDVHVVCLFETVEGAEAFGSDVYSKLPKIKNKPEIFGEQLIVDENDGIRDKEDILLINAARISVDQAVSLTEKYGGAAFPAHIDKTSNGIIEMLGGIPPEASFAAAEISTGCKKDHPARFLINHNGLKTLIDSDAHYLWQISEAEHSVVLPSLNRAAVIQYIKTIRQNRMNASVE